METIIVLSDRLKFNMPPEFRMIYPESKNDLARRLVGEPKIRCLILDFPENSEENRKLLLSIKQNFPVLNTAVILPEKFREEAPDYLYLETQKNDSKVKEGLTGFIRQSRYSNKRENHRFGWPLTAQYFKDNIWIDMEIYSISAGGAFLKSKNFLPSPGEEGLIKINFSNSSLQTSCRVTDNQGRSSKMPFGFAVRFTSLSGNMKNEIDSVVNDAIISLLLDPDSKPEIPTLGNEGLDEEDPFTI